MTATRCRPICRTALCCLLLFLSVPASALTVTVFEEANGEPVENAVITVPGTDKPARADHTMAQRDRAFQPEVLIIPVGSDVDFPNQDNILHHVYSFSPAKTFDIELYAGQPESPIHFDQAGVVELGCNIHDQMQGFIIVSDHEHHATTNASGEASFPDGVVTNDASLDIRLWHRRQQEVGRFETRTINPGASSRTEVRIELSPEPERATEFDDLQRQFQDM